MAGARSSPTAHLLRTSRLFSLPQPLPQTFQNLNVTNKFDSDTATVPYPRQAAIETTQSSLSFGDWGLKRALPLKSTTKTSTPLIRIGAVDSIYHITDFESAADHTLTLRKWQEIGMPMSALSAPPRRVTAPRSISHRSVFESNIDNSDKLSVEPGAKRWKFQGPWLAGQTEGDFQQYIQMVSKRKLEFKGFVRKHLLERNRASQQRLSMEEGREIEHDQVVVSEKELEAYIRHLRQDPETLHKLIGNFLDLPMKSEVLSTSFSEMRGLFKFIRPDSNQDGQGPPITHPSAGLSYLRTTSHIHNHPIIGPQQYQEPVQARVLVPQANSRGKKSSSAFFGVGGVVAVDSVRSSFGTGDIPGVSRFDPDIPGGAKIWVDLQHAIIDTQGRIKARLTRTHPHAQAIYKGLVQDHSIPINTEGNNRESSDVAKPPPSGNGSRHGSYGLGLNKSAQYEGRAKPLKTKISDDGTQDILDLFRTLG